MALPTLTPEQRTAALAQAMEARKARAEVIAALKSGEKTVPQLLSAPSPDPVVAKIKVTQLLNAVPGLGPVSVEALMDNAGIATNRRVAGLGERQRTALLAELS
jgi:hypothetical protein